MFIINRTLLSLVSSANRERERKTQHLETKSISIQSQQRMTLRSINSCRARLDFRFHLVFRQRSAVWWALSARKCCLVPVSLCWTIICAGNSSFLLSSTVDVNVTLSNFGKYYITYVSRSIFRNLATMQRSKKKHGYRILDRKLIRDIYIPT